MTTNHHIDACTIDRERNETNSLCAGAALHDYLMRLLARSVGVCAGRCPEWRHVVWHSPGWHSPGGRGKSELVAGGVIRLWCLCA